jgi:hypothetical protein
MLKIQVDTRRLNAAMQEYAKIARKDLDFIIRQQAGILVGNMIALTPPAAGRGQAITDRGGIASSAKKRGEARIAADIAALFPTTRIKDEAILGMIDAGFEWGTGRGKKTVRQFAPTVADLARIHKEARSKSTGRVKTGSTGQNMAVTRASVRNAYTRQAIKSVGILNAGWLRAARDLKTAARATPAWITRHGPKSGGVSIMRTWGGLAVTVSNRVPYFPKDMDRRVQRAIDHRYRGLRKAIEAMIERRNARANARMNRR